MQVLWEPTDLRQGRRVWRDAACMIAKEDWSSEGTMVVLLVLETGRIMTHGDEHAVAAYMSHWGYRPTEEK